MEALVHFGMFLCLLFAGLGLLMAGLGIMRWGEGQKARAEKD
ncbi:hypothetical protein ACFORG_05395 [Lutimaribacter marinistellae]|uniref:Uncharacterized protein n=1 Tax=Lutimaribacter marinistellae TaxID=1820329 RepID=A0ABV7TE02_9RHOB